MAKSLETRIAEKAHALGFDAIGFCAAELSAATKSRLACFIDNEWHGTMSWMAERVEQRSDPKALWPEVQSVISLGISYAPEHDPRETLGRPDIGTISVYARHRDYHDVLKGMIKTLAQFLISLDKTCAIKVFVDTAPVMEKPLAAKARLGWQGKHTNLVSRKHGSWLLLGEIYTTLVLQPSSSEEAQPDQPVGFCGTCTRCLTACPTNAFPAAYQLDARRCIAYLTIEHKGAIPEEFRKAIGNRIYGCDDCLSACPWNKFAALSRHMKLQPRPELMAPDLAYLAQLSDSDFRSLFAGSPIKRIGRARFVRNVLIAIGNTKNAKYRAIADRLTSDIDPIVVDAAQWALQELPRALR